MEFTYCLTKGESLYTMLDSQGALQELGMPESLSVQCRECSACCSNRLARVGGAADAPLPEPSVLSVSSKVSCWLMAVPHRSSFQLMLFILGRSPFEALSASRGDSCGVRPCRVQANPELT